MVLLVFGLTALLITELECVNKGLSPDPVATLPDICFWHKADIPASELPYEATAIACAICKENGRQFGGLKVGSGEDPSPETDADRQVCK
jgi:hypothetical protein